ncbi:hypothetical protein AGIG_G24137 [Arapaima gigas]
MVTVSCSCWSQDPISPAWDWMEGQARGLGGATTPPMSTEDPGRSGQEVRNPANGRQSTLFSDSTASDGLDVRSAAPQRGKEMVPRSGSPAIRGEVQL